MNYTDAPMRYYRYINVSYACVVNLYNYVLRNCVAVKVNTLNEQLTWIYLGSSLSTFHWHTSIERLFSLIVNLTISISISC